MPINITFTRLVSLIVVFLVLFLYLINAINVETSLNISKKNLEKKISDNESQLNSLTTAQNLDLNKEIDIKQNSGIVISVNTLQSQKISDFIPKENSASEQNPVLRPR